MTDDVTVTTLSEFTSDGADDDGEVGTGDDGTDLDAESDASLDAEADAAADGVSPAKNADDIQHLVDVVESLNEQLDAVVSELEARDQGAAGDVDLDVEADGARDGIGEESDDSDRMFQ